MTRNGLKYIKCQCCPHIETSQLIYSANQLTGFYMRATLALNGLKYINIEVSLPAFIQLPALCTKTDHVPPSPVLNCDVLEYGPQPFTVLSFTLTSYLLK